VPDVSELRVFAGASIVFLAIPGPAVAYIVARSVSQGRRAGVVSALGVQAGGIVHVLGAAVGVSALIASSATAFTVVKLVGAAYLVWLGVRKLLTKEALGAERPEPESERRLFWQGAVVNVLNPKTALFFLAFLPQFVDPAGAAPALQVIVLGLLFLALATLSDALYAVLAGGLAHRLRSVWAERASGGVLVALGVAAATAKRA
jgi:threonine/homoserine/homoserine lactone efflux protein